MERLPNRTLLRTAITSVLCNFGICDHYFLNFKQIGKILDPMAALAFQILLRLQLNSLLISYVNVSDISLKRKLCCATLTVI